MPSYAQFDVWQSSVGGNQQTVLQCQHLLVNSISSWSSPVSSQTIITPLTISITPKLATSKIVIHWMVNGELHQDNVFRVFKNNAEATNGRNTTNANRWSGYSSAFYDQNESSTPSSWNMLYIDTPGSTSQQQYQMAVGGSGATAYTFYLNGTVAAGNGVGSDNLENMVSAVVAWEIAQ